MMARPLSTGPRIYNLFPLLCGPIVTWRKFLPQIAEMNFDWVYVNPFHYPGFSGSLYAVKDYYRLNTLFRGKARRDDATLLTEFVRLARKHGMAVMMDLVVNHTAKDSVLSEQHPDWFAREPDGSIRSPFAIDPADANRKTVWGDLGEIDYGSPTVRAEVIEYWKGVVRYHADLGFSGFRCDAAYKVPAEVWEPIIAEARRLDSEARFFAETLGCRLEQVKALEGVGFDFLFNSVKWWDLRAPWALEQYEMFRKIAPSVGFPESHDTERLAGEASTVARQSDDVRKFYLLRYAVAACFSTGVLMPIGYEFGFRRRLDVVRTRPSDWEQPQFDLRSDIADINNAKACCPALNEEGPQRYHADDGGGIALLRSTDDARSHAVFAANPSSTASARIDLAPLLAAANVAPNALCNVTPRAETRDSPLTIDLRPLEWQILLTT